MRRGDMAWVAMMLGVVGGLGGGGTLADDAVLGG
eukprot:CAMPEP_0118714658 /NCGR_PEP_ID=MMETSP0800-20121206/26335_1 /TAXON_ID=210618 ORGANISM="Striatella unipunctata, Strain CCMP2910" /NCGR_SAMPLE_ID=MMETSP0800 /ASSEMBLY_ACC=CAM_ASM_000638 /LENGTH=33 /DNA_ID= /DNA_START= /DNA_END= /DNA_ORIENTATION=